MLKKHELHERTVRPFVCRDTRHAQGHGPVVCSSSSTRLLGCVFQDMEPPRLSSILRKNSDMQKPIQRVKFTKAIARHAKIRDPNPSLGMICPGELHQRNLRIGLRKRRNGKSEVSVKQRGGWPKVCIKYKEKNKATFFSLSEKEVLVCIKSQTQRKENLLSTPVRQCTWSAKKNRVMLKWILWWNRVVPRRSWQPMEKCRRMKRQRCMSKYWVLQRCVYQVALIYHGFAQLWHSCFLHMDMFGRWSRFAFYQVALIYLKNRVLCGKISHGFLVNGTFHL